MDDVSELRASMYGPVLEAYIVSCNTNRNRGGELMDRYIKVGKSGKNESERDYARQVSRAQAEVRSGGGHEILTRLLDKVEMAARFRS